MKRPESQRSDARQARTSHTAWRLLAMTGMRRGELLALRWRDIDLEAGTISVRRSVGLIRVKGQKPEIKEGATKTNKPRVVDIDEATMTLLRAHKRERGGLALALARDQALVFGDEEGRPERFSRTFKDTLRRCGKQLTKQEIEPPPVIRLHDLRHTHATLVSSRPCPSRSSASDSGHASPTVTLTVYAHVLPGNQRDAADKFAALVAEARNSMISISAGITGRLGREMKTPRVCDLRQLGAFLVSEG